ncbi:MAG: hypothetical protein Q7T18_06015 [Sedimentisphaerales bacterium]|nr:hypothetical protein [Sedimentisphaerales bacterium]
MHNLTLVIVNVAAALVITGMIVWLFLFYRKRSSAILKHLESIEKEAKKIEDTQVNNTVSLSDIHGIVSSIDGKQPFHEPHQNN